MLSHPILLAMYAWEEGEERAAERHRFRTLRIVSQSCRLVVVSSDTTSHMFDEETNILQPWSIRKITEAAIVDNCEKLTGVTASISKML